MTQPLHVILHIPAHKVASEMTRLLSLPQNDTRSLQSLYREAVENLAERTKT